MRAFNAVGYEDAAGKYAILKEMLGGVGRNVLIASNVQIYTATHSVIPEERRSSGGGDACITIAKPVTIKDNAWIGGGAIILPGVTIGEGTTIGAGSVVTRDIPDRCVAVGNPCRVIRTL